MLYFTFLLVKQDNFCGLLTIDCPNSGDFEAMDDNDDGNLTFEEYMEANFGSA